nr:hypothetical protein [Microbacterium bovistercoris]
MEFTRTDAARRRIVVGALILGPVLAVTSAAVGLSAGGGDGGMRAQFESMAAHASTILAQDLLETFGFMLTLAALAGATQALRTRGGALGTIGAVLAILGIAGFSMSNATGLAVVALAEQSDQDAAFTMAKAISGGGVIGTAGTVGFVLEVLAQIGMILVIAGLVRARLMPVWVLVPVIVGIGVNAVVGTMAATLVADVLLLATCAWIAVRLARCARSAWLGGDAERAQGRRSAPLAPQGVQ